LRLKFQENVSSNLSVRYGSTETGTISIAYPGDHDLDGCVGHPLPGVEIQIKRLESLENAGMLRIKAPGMATEYIDASENQGSAFDDGWFQPGDLGEITASGMLQLRGRNSEAFTLDGINIFPRELEAAMLKNAAVKDVVVVKKESQTHDGIPIAFAILNPGHKFDEFSLLTWARKEMGLASPRQIFELKEFPASDQGKIDYQKLHLLARDGL
jgi:long-subunit acyl-CoA synthetase (AMP-forming)